MFQYYAIKLLISISIILYFQLLKIKLIPVLSCQNEACTVHEWNEKKILKGLGSPDEDSLGVIAVHFLQLVSAACNSSVVEPRNKKMHLIDLL